MPNTAASHLRARSVDETNRLLTCERTQAVEQLPGGAHAPAVAEREPRLRTRPAIADIDPAAPTVAIARERIAERRHEARRSLTVPGLRRPQHIDATHVLLAGLVEI